MVIGVVMLSLLLDLQPRAFGSAIRLIYVLPGVITGAASVLLWYLMLQPETSPFAPLLNVLGFHTSADMFQNSRLPVIFALMAFATGFGQWVVIIFGSLQSISSDILEAAKLDGASAIQLAFQIKLPLISKYVVYMLVLSFAGALQIFAEPTILSSIAAVGSPTWSINQLGLFFATQNGDFPSSAVISLLLLAFSLLVAVVIITRGNLFQTDVAE